MMSMGYISVDKTKTNLRVAGEFWVFLFLTLILLAMTFGTYLGWELKGRPKRSSVRAGTRK